MTQGSLLTVNHPDWDNIGFKVREGAQSTPGTLSPPIDLLSIVNGHVESHYSTKTGIWTEPEFVEDPLLRIHGLAPGLNYGQQAYEGIKAFRSPNDQSTSFAPSQNASRMAHSASFISIPAVPNEHFLKSVHLAVSLNAEYVPPHHTGAACTSALCFRQLRAIGP
jgi:branched-chain amino acid aminotransferase